VNECATVLEKHPILGTALVFALATLAFAVVAAVAGTGPGLLPTGLFAAAFTAVYVAVMRYWERRNRSSPA
jgi:Flp pilus assembly protein TadB